MLGNSEKGCSEQVTFYDSAVLLMLVRSTSARRQGAVENPRTLFQTQSNRQKSDKSWSSILISLSWSFLLYRNIALGQRRPSDDTVQERRSWRVLQDWLLLGYLGAVLQPASPHSPEVPSCHYRHSSNTHISKLNAATRFYSKSTRSHQNVRHQY
jgi:hypothetical protein